MSYSIIIRGPLGSGKTTVSKKLAEILSARYISIDDILDEYKLAEDKEDGYISQRSFLRANEIAVQRAIQFLESGTPVIFDGNFYWKSQIEDLIRRQLQFPHYIFTLKTPLEVCIERDSKRENPHGKDAAEVIYNKTNKFDYGIVINATWSVEQIVSDICKLIHGNKVKTLVQEVNEYICIWAKDYDKLVVAIDGYTGIGKTTLLNELASLNSDILAVNRDDFVLSRYIVAEKLAKAEDKSKIWELEVCDNEKLIACVDSFRRGDHSSYSVDTYDSVSGEVNTAKVFDFTKKVMVVEGVFMFHPELPLNKLWDKRIYLKGDLTKIDERRIKREKERWGKDYFPETHPDSYLRQVTTGLKRYAELYKPETVADVVIYVD